MPMRLKNRNYLQKNETTKTNSLKNPKPQVKPTNLASERTCLKKNANQTGKAIPGGKKTELTCPLDSHSQSQILRAPTKKHARKLSISRYKDAKGMKTNKSVQNLKPPHSVPAEQEENKESSDISHCAHSDIETTSGSIPVHEKSNSSRTAFKYRY